MVAQIVRFFERCHQWQTLLEVIESEQSAQHTLVVAKHEKAARSNKANAPVEGFALKLASSERVLRKISKLGEDALEAAFGASRSMFLGSELASRVAIRVWCQRLIRHLLVFGHRLLSSTGSAVLHDGRIRRCTCVLGPHDTRVGVCLRMQVLEV